MFMHLKVVLEDCAMDKGRSNQVLHFVVEGSRIDTDDDTIGVQKKKNVAVELREP